MKRNLQLLRRRLKLTALGNFAPEFSVAFEWGAVAADEYFLSLPFRRSIPLILMAAAFLAAFSVPLFSMGGFITGSGDSSLFSLVFTLFSLFWLLGWSTGVALLLLLFLCVSIGRETLHVSQNKLTIRIGIPGIAFGMTYSGDLIRNFQFRESEVSKAKQWRGSHIAFDYGGNDVELGSALSGIDAQKIISRLEALFPEHDAAPVEIDLTELEPINDSAEVSRVSMPEQAPDSGRGEAPRWNSASGITLILANLIPLGGVLLDEWAIGEIMLLYWAESAIIGIYNLCKMWQVGRWSIALFGPFFIGHYAAFMAVHLLFIYAFFGAVVGGEADVSRLQVLTDLLTLWPALLGLAISHGVSYYLNFIKSGEFEGRSMSVQMREPYRRIIIMHLTIIFGGFLALSLGTGLAALLLLLSMKIGADLHSHISQHSK